MSVLSLIALLFGTAGVWLTIKKTIWCWPVSLVAVVASMYEFFEASLFGDFALQVFYFGAGIYGWYYWNRNSNPSFQVERVKEKYWVPLVAATFLQAILYYFLLVKFKGDQALFDALLTAGSLTATYMMTKKWLENWAAWALIDFAYVFLYGIKGMWLFALLYLFFAVMAYYGWIKWKAELKK